MPRIQPLTREQMPQFEHKFVAAEKADHFVPNFVRTLARRPDIYDAHQELRRVIVGPGTVSEDLKILIAEVASLSAGCNYCAAHNANFAVRADIDEKKHADIWNYETSPLFSDAERAALSVAQGAAQVPNAVSDEDFVQLKRHFSDEQIVEIVAVIALFGFLNRFNDTMATEIEAAPVVAAEKFLKPFGWSGGTQGNSK